ncbi:Integral membrane protein TerC [Xylanimonas cellulosilytica DSM 15894]|uniref:Integral membrane protein TerC n=1 Tax=Xylanimonas cellulosilytica (strain DSM 15894 / JCM 12276 / CECT 5975 / KCTC 9989 / LMG 20990 / NBRC 107835 / XIL07) TaxID=446471 RepID=D1BS72_XYLCX|nr:TerC family protein [Xylanimonas cellulosilytica]ACZ30564.1 Integral membrane protein TerC [Xylanimonas cellulosilytica DSM 15894]
MVHELPTWFQAVSLSAMVGLLLADLIIVGRRPHVPSVRESALWVGFYVALAIAFAGILWAVGGQAPATEFVAGWITEYSLSVDNLFVFVLIMTRFAVPRQYQQRVLMVGIIVALVLRAAFIVAGAAALEQLTWLFYIFGAFLVYTAIGLLRGDDDAEEYKENRLIRVLRRVLPLHDEYDGGALRTTVDRKRLFTPMVVVFVAIGSTDVLFALDSIPAIFGLTRDPFLVFSTNLFALMGLRQLYFLLGGLLERLVYLPYALAVILGFIGIKLVLEAMHENTLPFINHGHHIGWAPAIPIWASLSVILGSLAIATVASLLRTSRRAAIAD